MTDCVVLIPVLKRPHRAQPVYDAFRNTCNARILFICTPGDTAEQEAVAATGADWYAITKQPGNGDYARKINHAITQTCEPLIFLGADDIAPRPGWYDAAVAKLRDGIGVIGTNDLSNRRVMRGEHSTHSLVTRDYVEQYGTVDEPGKALHEGYPHEFVDDEFVQTAKYRRAFAFAFDAHVEHLHPLYGKAPTDALYDQHAQRMKVGRRIYEQRAPLWIAPS